MPRRSRKQGDRPNTVATDTFGEFLTNMPGVEIEMHYGEVRYVRLRGLATPAILRRESARHRAIFCPDAASGDPAVSTQNAPEPSPVADQTRWFAEEVHAHDSQLKSYLRGSFPSVRDVDDVVQESYLRVWRRQLLRPLASARSFLYKVARNLAIDALRRETISPVDRVSDLAALNVLDGSPNAADAACTTDELNLLLEAIESLPPRCREVVVLSKLRGLSPGEIALKLGISEGTVHVHGGKGVRRCEEFLRERGVVRTEVQ
ncbi:MAG: RNA polymerase sigma factor [Opitutaceae bacterium]